MSFNSFIQPSIVLQRFLIEGQGQCCCFRTTSQGMPISEYQGGLSTKNKSIQFGKVFFSFSDKLIFIILLRDLKLAPTCYQNGESEKDKLRTIVKNTFFNYHQGDYYVKNSVMKKALYYVCITRISFHHVLFVAWEGSLRIPA